MWLRRAEILRSVIGGRSGIKLQDLGDTLRLRNESTFETVKSRAVVVFEGIKASHVQVQHLRAYLLPK